MEDKLEKQCRIFTDSMMSNEGKVVDVKGGDYYNNSRRVSHGIPFEFHGDHSAAVTWGLSRNDVIGP